MTERNLSQEAYNRIFNEGLLGKRQFEAYHILFYCGPLPRNEIDRLAGQQFHTEPHANPPWSRRLTELEARGVVKRAGVAKDPNTGFDCELWDVTDQLPAEKVKASPIPKPEEFEEAIDFIRPAVRYFVLDSEAEQPKSVEKLLRWLEDKNAKRAVDAARKEKAKAQK